MARRGDIMSRCSQWALRQWELPGHGNEQDLIPVSPHSPGLPWATLHPSLPRSSKWDPRESLPGRWVQPCPLSRSLFPWDRAPNPLHPSGAVVLRHCPQQVPDQALATGPHSTRSVWGGDGLQPPGGADTPLTDPPWIFQAGGRRLQSPGRRDPWRASRSHLPAASAPTTTPPGCGASMTP